MDVKFWTVRFSGQFLVLSFCDLLHDGFNDTTYRRCCTLEMSGSAFFSNLIFFVFQQMLVCSRNQTCVVDLYLRKSSSTFCIVCYKSYMLSKRTGRLQLFFQTQCVILYRIIMSLVAAIFLCFYIIKYSFISSSYPQRQC